jgi:hypothetical protein
MAAHGFHPVRSIEPQPLHNRGQLIRNRSALVRAEFPTRPIQQHDIVLDINGQKPPVGSPRMQTPRGGDARGWTGIIRRLRGRDRVRDGDRDWPGF